MCYAIKSDRQVSHVPEDLTAGFRNVNGENTQVLAVGMATRKYCRSKCMVNLLNAFHYSLPNIRLLQIETSLANAVIQKLEQHPSGKCLFEFLVEGQFLYFHIDNCDFDIDTPDGKGQLHGALTVLFQRKVNEAQTYNITDIDMRSRSCKIDATEFTDVQECDAPFFKTKFQLPSGMSGHREKEALSKIEDEILPWQLVKSNTQVQRDVPSLSGYQALVQEQPNFVTNIAPLPIIPRPVTEWGTIYTALKTAQGITAEVIGPGRMTTITLDLALYEKAMQLVGSRPDLRNHFNLRLGELHVVKAHLLAIGSFITGSGYDLVWNEAGVYGPTTTKAILNASHIKRGIQAHEDNLIALTQLMTEKIYEETPVLESQIQRVCDGFSVGDREQCRKVQKELKSLHFESQVKAFVDSRMGNSKARFAVKYMDMIRRGQNYVFATRNRDWIGHLEASEDLCKDLFSQDRIKYMRMTPLYIRSQFALQETDPETWNALASGDFCVNKTDLPFVSIGVDHAGEQVNNTLNVDGGITGIASNQNARDRYCFTAPIIARMVGELADYLCMSSNSGRSKHHQLIPSEVRKQADRVDKIKATIKRHRNPFAEESDMQLCNIVTGKVVPVEFTEGIINADVEGQKLYRDFVETRLEKQTTGLWERVSRNNLPSFAKPDPKVKKTGGKESADYLKQEKDMLGRFLVISRSSRSIDEKEIIGNYELGSYPKSLFQGDSLLACSDKSEVARHLNSTSQNTFQSITSTIGTTEGELESDDEWSAGSTTTSVDSLDNFELWEDGFREELQELIHDQNQPLSNREVITVTEQVPEVSKKCLVIDGMAILHLVSDKAKIQTVRDISTAFNAKIEKTMSMYDQIMLVFDPYCEGSRKTTTREKRNKGIDATYYAVNESTSLVNVTMMQYLAHEKTKQELGVFLAKNFIETYKDRKEIFVTAYTSDGVYTSATHANVEGEVVPIAGLMMNHDEADTMLITVAIYFTQRASSDDIIHVWSPDIDVLLLLIHYRPLLLNNSLFFWLGKTYDITGIFSYLGPDKAMGILGWHALTGCDTCGKFALRGKKSWWNLFLELNTEDDKDIIEAFKEFGQSAVVSNMVETALARFVTLNYAKDKGNLPAARWHLFTKKMVTGDKLPPTPNAFRQHMLRALVQTYTWRHAHLPKVPPLDVNSGQFGWNKKGDNWIPIPITTEAAPSSIMQLIKCNCHGTCDTRACSCFKETLPCTEMCHVSDDNCCENIDSNDVAGIDSDEEEVDEYL